MIQIINNALLKDHLDVEKTNGAENRLVSKKPSLNSNLKKLAGVNDISAARGNLYSL